MYVQRALLSLKVKPVVCEEFLSYSISLLFCTLRAVCS